MSLKKLLTNPGVRDIFLKMTEGDKLFFQEAKAFGKKNAVILGGITLAVVGGIMSVADQAGGTASMGFNFYKDLAVAGTGLATTAVAGITRVVRQVRQELKK